MSLMQSGYLKPVDGAMQRMFSCPEYVKERATQRAEQDADATHWRASAAAAGLDRRTNGALQRLDTSTYHLLVDALNANDRGGISLTCGGLQPTDLPAELMSKGRFQEPVFVISGHLKDFSYVEDHYGKQFRDAGPRGKCCTTHAPRTACFWLCARTCGGVHVSCTPTS